MDAVDLYTIGVQLVLDDQIVTQIDAVTTSFNALQEAIDKVNQSLKLTNSRTKALLDQSGDLAGNWGRAADAAARVATNWGEAASSATLLAAAADKLRGAGDVAAPDLGGGYDPSRPNYQPRPGPAPGANQQHDSSTHDFWTSLFLFGTGYEAVKYAVGGAAEVSATQARLAINQASPAQIAKLTATANTVQAGQPLSIQDVLGIGQDYYSESN